MRVTPHARFSTLLAQLQTSDRLSPSQSNRLEQSFSQLTGPEQQALATRLTLTSGAANAKAKALLGAKGSAFEALARALPAAPQTPADLKPLAALQTRSGLDALMGSPSPSRGLEQRVERTLGRAAVADELLQVLADSRAQGLQAPALLAQLASAGRQGLEQVHLAASQHSSPELLSVYAEEAGKLLELVRATEGHREAPEALRAGFAALANRVVDLQVARLRQLANGGADSIPESESVAVSLQADLGRLRRYGAPARSVDVEGLLFAVKRAVVDRFAR